MRRRTDLMIKWRYGEAAARQEQKVVIGIKTIRSRDGYERVKAEGVAQTAGYVRLCGTKEAHLLIFDRDGNRGWQAILSDNPDGLPASKAEGITSGKASGKVDGKGMGNGMAGSESQKALPQPIPDPGVPFRDQGEHEGLVVDIWGF
jgi:hypothetical protein